MRSTTRSSSRAPACRTCCPSRRIYATGSSVTNGVSKTYAMTGWRLGYGVGNPELVAAINKLQSQSSSCPSSISQAAAAEAISGDQSFVAESIVSYRERRDLVFDLLA